MTLRIVFLGLSLSSSWGNGHATTFRALLRGLRARGHDVLFLERDVPWYAQHRDLPDPDFCRLVFYNDPNALSDEFAGEIADADAVVIGSYVPDGIAVINHVLASARGVRAFYDIDTPVTLAGLAAETVAYLDAAQIPEFDLYLSFTGGPTLGRLAQTFGATNARAFYCSVDETLYRPIPHAPRWSLGYLGTYSPDRQPMLERLLIEPARRLPNHRFVVAGPQYPAEIEWPGNVERIEHLAPAAHPGFYNQQRFTLNVTRADMVAAGWSPSVRLFEAAACGTPVISDRWPGLTALLPEGQAILVADTTQQAVAMIQTSDAERVRLATCARAIVLAQHTGVARAADLESALTEVAAMKASARSRTRLPA